MASHALLIEDDVTLAESIRRATALHGLELSVANSWDDGLTLFITEFPDVVFADYNLPGSKHGLELLLRMKELRPSVEVHLVSAVLTESEIQEILAFEVLDGAMTKLDPIKTIETIVEIIKLAPMRGNASAATDWRRLADARVKFGKANVAKLRALDEFLQARLGKTK